MRAATKVTVKIGAEAAVKVAVKVTVNRTRPRSRWRSRAGRGFRKEHPLNDVLYSVDDAVATIVLNRPEAMNSLTVRAKTALLEALTSAAQASSVRAVLLPGRGGRSAPART